MKLLDVNGGHRTVRGDMRTMAYNLYNSRAIRTSYSERDRDSIKQNFGRIANANKSTGDLNCPAIVRSVKVIAK